MNIEIKKIVIKYTTEWPKNIDSKQLLERLDKFAKEIIETQKILDIAKELELRK